MDVFIKNKKLNINKLEAFGFACAGTDFVYSTEIVDGQMRMTVTVSRDGSVRTEVIDNGSGEEYVLHGIDSAVGAFVGKVKSEHEAVIERIVRECFETEVFKARQTKSIIRYVSDTYGDELEYLWQKFPDNAVVRRADNKKWYAAFLTVTKNKLGKAGAEAVEIIDLRMRPEDIERVVDGKKILPGYHMNKKHWITICLDGSVENEEICALLDESYRLADK